MTRDEMKARMSHREFTEWMLIDKLEPIGERRLDFLAALIAATIANVNRDPTRAAMKISDFIPNFDAPPKRDQTPEQMHAAFAVFKKAREARQRITG